MDFVSRLTFHEQLTGFVIYLVLVFIDPEQVLFYGVTEAANQFLAAVIALPMAVAAGKHHFVGRVLLTGGCDAVKQAGLKSFRVLLRYIIMG